jgi:hypothetical protein
LAKHSQQAVISYSKKEDIKPEDRAVSKESKSRVVERRLNISE